MKDKFQTRRNFIKRVSAAGMASTAGWEVLFSAPEKKIKEPAPKKGRIILFQGDSITDGNRTRNNDWNHIMGHGYAYLIAAKLGFEKPAEAFHFINRGVSGDTITDLTARWQTDTLDLKPDILSILIGVNDVDGNITGRFSRNVKDFNDQYRKLLALTKEKLPDVQLVIGAPFLLPVGRIKEKWQQYQDSMKEYQDIIAAIAGDFKAVYIPFQEEFNKALKLAPADYWIWDGIHPMPAGHECMARKWISATGLGN